MQISQLVKMSSFVAVLAHPYPSLFAADSCAFFPIDGPSSGAPAFADHLLDVYSISRGKLTLLGRFPMRA